MITEYKIDRNVDVADCDMHGYIRPAAVFRILQSAASEHALTLGEPFAKPKHGRAKWVVARFWYELHSPVKLGDRLSVYTAVRIALGFVFYRDFEVYDEEGLLVATATGTWMLANRETKKNIGLGLTDGMSLNKVYGSKKLSRLPRFKLPQNVKKVRDYTFLNSDIDINGHATNSRYADIAFDTLKPSMYEKSYVSEIQINYNKECFVGETVSVEVSRDKNYYYARGAVDGESRFDVRFRLAEKRAESSEPKEG